MELVYLWVEEYKNIHKQGFNFSGRYKCDYNTEKNELTIHENKNYVHIFPENINVTAIVGKNGSGKSSLFRIIYFLIYYHRLSLLKNDNEKKSKDLNAKDSNGYSGINVIEFKSGRERTSFKGKKYLEILKQLEEESVQAFLVIRQNKKYSYITNIHDLQLYLNKRNEKLSITGNEINSNFIYFNFFGYSFENHFKGNWYRAFYRDIEQIKNEVSIPLFAEPYISENGDINYNFHEKLLRMRYNSVIDKIKSEKINIFFNPNSIKFKINTHYFDISLSLLSAKNENNPILELGNSIGYGIDDNENFDNLLSENRVNDFKSRIDEAVKGNDLKTLTKLHLLFEILLNARAIRNEMTVYIREKFIEERFNIEDILNEMEEYLSDEKNSIITQIRNEDLKVIELAHLLYLNQFFKNCSQLEDNINKLLPIDSYYEIIKAFPTWIDIEYYEGSKTISTLSSGEKVLFNLIITSFYHAYLESFSKKKSIYLFFDEVELGEHPAWQKRLITDCVNVYKKLNKEMEVNIITATHSPFVLSDIPKENVIFLDQYKKKEKEVKNGIQKAGNCKNVSNEIDIQPFGANIHTLLSHGFFMDNGLMGEFVKRQIRILNIVHKYITHKHQKKYLLQQSCKRTRRLIMKKMPYFWYIQSIIGEQFLQTIIKNQLQEVELFLLNKHEAIDKEIERLKQLKQSISQ